MYCSAAVIGPVVANDHGDERSELSPPEGPVSRIIPCLDEDLFQALADEIMARCGVRASDGGPRRPVFCSDLVP